MFHLCHTFQVLSPSNRGYMRLFRVLPVLSLLLVARASSLDSRGQASHPLDARDLLDVCVFLNAELAVPDDQGLLSAFGLISESAFSLSKTCS
jgi:hypothetical protein